jgi:DnaJ-class molecular chaperone
MSDVYIISACPKCGGMPIVRQYEEIQVFGLTMYDVMCEDCHDYSCIAYSPKQAIEEWEAHCKQKTRSREDA